jgi:hypothetical protein
VLPHQAANPPDSLHPKRPALDPDDATVASDAALAANRWRMGESFPFSVQESCMKLSNLIILANPLHPATVAASFTVSSYRSVHLTGVIHV